MIIYRLAAFLVVRSRSLRWNSKSIFSSVDESRNSLFVFWDGFCR